MKKVFSGQVMERATPPTSSTCGLRDWKSKCSSGSIEATRSASPSPCCANHAAALDAASAASFQPSKPAISTGFRSENEFRSQVSPSGTLQPYVDGVRQLFGTLNG